MGVPGPDDVAGLLPGPGSVVRARASDVRLFGAAGYALLLQVAHPTVAAGVRDHSSYRTDPWGRLLRTVDFVNLLVYGSARDAAALGQGLRRMHAGIRGVDPAGRPYRALEPTAYAWVHASLADTIVRGTRFFGRRLDPQEEDRFWEEWRDLGLLLGVRDRDLPATWRDYRAYLRRTIDEVLQYNDVVRDVVATASRPVQHLPWPLAGRVVGAAGRPVGLYGRLLTVGMMPAALRDKLGLRLSAPEQAAFAALAAANRAATPVLPAPLRRIGPVALRLRRPVIERGPFAAAS